MALAAVVKVTLLPVMKALMLVMEPVSVNAGGAADGDTASSVASEPLGTDRAVVTITPFAVGVRSIDAGDGGGCVFGDRDAGGNIHGVFLMDATLMSFGDGSAVGAVVDHETDSAVGGASF